ncbi:MAG: hypothetical protein PHD02_04525 [Bacilli bacterium]|nr:hypothetical protein [Bacilli bacterium]
MGKLYQKTLSVLLAAIMAMSAGAAVAKASSDTPAPSTTKEQPNYENDILGYTNEQIENRMKCGFDVKEYEEWLISIGAQIVDGNIIVSTPEQYKAIAEYKKEYDNLVIKKYKSNVAGTFLLLNNLDLLTTQPDMIYSLIDSGDIIYPFPFENGVVDEKYNLTVGSFYENMRSIGSTNDLSTYRVNSPFIFDAKLRADIAKIEEIDLYLAGFTQQAAVQDQDAYLNPQEDICNFYLFQKSSFPYPLAELHDSARLTVFYTLRNSIFIPMSTGFTSLNFRSAITSAQETAKTYDLFQPTIDEFTNKKAMTK